MIRSAICCTFLWKAAEGCCFTGKLWAVRGCGHNCACCISSVRPGWCCSCVKLQLEWKLTVATFTQSQCSLKVWKKKKENSVFPFVALNEWVNERPESCCDAASASSHAELHGGSHARPCRRRGTSSLTKSQWIYSEFSKGAEEKRRQDWGSVTGSKPVYT